MKAKNKIKSRKERNYSNAGKAAMKIPVIRLYNIKNDTDPC